ncbi:MAG: tetratricopeptide repeat protein [Alphaproteobacteria bacterium]
MARKAGARRKRKQPLPKGSRGHRAQRALQAALTAFQQGRPDETAELCSRILENAPREPGALHLLGVAYLTLGQFADAAETLHKASQADPQNPEIQANLGAALRAGGQFEAAEASLRNAIALKPDHPGAHFNLGNTLSEAGRTAEAVVSFRTVLNFDPAHAGAHNNLGLALEADGRTGEAMVCYQAALAAQPGFYDAHRSMAQLLRSQDRAAEALGHYQAAIAARPDDAASMNDCGVVLFELERSDDAVAMLRKALEVSDDYVDSHINLGNVLCAMDRPQEAIARFERALELDPDGADAIVNLGHAYKHQGDMRGAIATYERVIALEPDHDEAWFGKGFVQLLLGEFEDGWRGYRNRESMRGADDDYCREPLPQDLSGRNILVMFDQGIGDEIFFLRFLPALARRGAEIAYLPDSRLAAMFARAGIAEIVTPDDLASRRFDLKLSVGDLPHVLGPDAIGNTPPSIALAPLADREARLKEILAGFGPPPYIGATWRAGTRGRQSLLYKESPASRLAESLAPLDARVIALQRGPRDGEVEAFADALGREICDLTALNANIEDMLALVGLLDDYVCVSNTNVHLAAARDRACRLLIPTPPEFRWMAEGAESPWFPDMPVYRQAADGDWSAAFDILANDLKAQEAEWRQP